MVWGSLLEDGVMTTKYSVGRTGRRAEGKEEVRDGIKESGDRK